MRDRLVFLSTSEEALKVYQALTDSMKADGLKQRSHVPPYATELGSAPLQQVQYIYYNNNLFNTIVDNRKDKTILLFKSFTSCLFGCSCCWKRS